MSKRSLKAFMREAAKTEEIVKVPGPETMLDENGSPIMLEVKILSNETIQDINDMCTQRVMAVDKNGKPYIENGEVAFKKTINNRKVTGHILAEALVYPDLKDPELMKFFNCFDISEMAAKVFPKVDEYMHVTQAVLSALGFGRDPDDGLVDTAKN